MNFLAPYMTYIKVGLVALLVGGAVWLTWDYRDAKAEKDKREAVTDAIREASKGVEVERTLRQHYQTLADTKYAAMMKSISNIKVEHKTITNNITNEVAGNPEFYGQQLPPGGYEQWKKARESAAR